MQRCESKSLHQLLTAFCALAQATLWQRSQHMDDEDFSPSVLARTAEVEATIEAIDAALRSRPAYLRERAENGVC